MAIGRPDYFSLPTTPKYGSTFVKAGESWVGLGTETIVFTHTFVGVFRALVFAATDLTAYDDVAVTLEIDGQTILSGNLTEICSSRWSDASRAFVTVHLVDLANLEYVIEVAKDISVQTAVVLTIEVSSLISAGGTYLLVYDEIEG